MKTLLIHILIVLIFINCTPSSKTAVVAKKDKDMGEMQNVSSDSIQSMFNYARDNQTNNPFPDEKVMLGNGQYALIATSDNLKTKAVLGQYPKISPVTFLKELSNIEGVIRMYRRNEAKLWITREQADSLFSLCRSTTSTPMLSAFSQDFIFFEDKAMDSINVSSMRSDYIKMPMGYNALSMINAHISGYFPSDINESESRVRVILGVQ